MRALLIATYALTPPGFNWEVRRWDGNQFHRADPDWPAAAAAQIRVWETPAGELVGAVHPEDGGDAHLELHPAYRDLIEEEMLAWAEDHLMAPAGEPGCRRLHVFAYEYDIPRRRLLLRRGYERMPRHAVVRRLRLGYRPLPEPALPPGYTLRTTRPGDEGDYARLAAILNAGFGRTCHTAAEYRQFATGSPSFRHDLNLVAEAPDGSFAAHVGVTYVPANHYGVFEPVCTHPAHRRRNLARSLMGEGLRRLAALGAADVYVGTGDAVPANELYDAVGFTEAYTGCVWRKTVGA